MLDHVQASSGFFGAADALEIILNVSIFFIFGVMVEYGIVEAAVTESKKVTATFSFTYSNSMPPLLLNDHSIVIPMCSVLVSVYLSKLVQVLELLYECCNLKCRVKDT